MRSTTNRQAACLLTLLSVLFGTARSEAGNVDVPDLTKFARESLTNTSIVKVESQIDYTSGITLPPGTNFKVAVGLDGSFRFDSPVNSAALFFLDPNVQNNATISVANGGGPNSTSVTYNVALGGGVNQGLDPGDLFRFDPPGGAFYSLVGDTLTGENNPAEITVNLFDQNNNPIDTGGNHMAVLANSKKTIEVSVEQPGFKRIDDQDPRFFEGGGLLDNTARVNLLFDNTLKLPNGMMLAGIQDLGDVEITIYTNNGSLNPLATIESPNFNGGRQTLTRLPNVFQGVFSSGDMSTLNQEIDILIGGMDQLSNIDIFFSAAFLPLLPNEPVTFLEDRRLTKWRDQRFIFDDDFESGDTSAWSGAVP
jgi:hypothetical protein